MFDFTWTEHTLDDILYCVAVYILFLVLFYKKYLVNALVSPKRTDRLLVLIAFILIITACIDGDWFNYRRMVYDYEFVEGAHNHGEPIYAYIIKFVNKNYLLFRIFVWGAALWLTSIAFKRYGVNYNMALFFLIAVFLIKFNYSRATLGMACYFAGLSFLLIPQKGLNVVGLLLAIILFRGAYEFHHSMLILIVLTSVIFLPADKPVIIILGFLLLPFFATYLKENATIFDQLENEYLSEKVKFYFARETEQSNIFGIIENVINYGVFVVPLILDTVIIVRNRKKISTPMLRLYRIIFGVTIMSLSFWLMELDSTFFIYRTLFMSFIPITILTVYLYEKHFMSYRQYSLIIFWGISAISFRLLHLIWEYR